jgi:hypothetical protein
MIVRRPAVWLAAAILATLAVGGISLEHKVEAQPATAPAYDDEDNLLLPADFETWIFVGSNLGLAYRPGLVHATPLEAARSTPQEIFHNVYINREAYEYFREHETFPDPTILVMEEFAAADREPEDVLAKGVFNGERLGLKWR